MVEVLSEADIYAFRRNLVLAASAGTGKTHALVGVLVHLLLGESELGGRSAGPVSPARVVATTFSRKAAAEIRARLASELELIARSPESSRYFPFLEQARSRRGEGAVARHALARQASVVLAGLSQAHVGTIHSFAFSLVREHALELGLSAGLEIADEDEVRERGLAAVARALEELFVKRKDDVRSLVDVVGGVDTLVVEVSALLGSLDEDGRGAEALVIDPTDPLVLERQMDELLAHAYALRKEPRYGEHAAALLAARPEGGEELERAALALFSVRKSTKESPVGAAFSRYVDGLPKSDDTKRNKALRVVRGHALRHVFTRRAEVLRELLVASEREVDRERRATAALGFGEVLRALRELLVTRPDVASAIGARFDALLVDEFQDTSRLQKDIVQLLWAREETRGPRVQPHVRDVRGSGLLVVGDRKQSIYGFRGADVSVFAELCVGLAGAPAREKLRVPDGAVFCPEVPSADFVPLQHNRRGEPELLAFANAFSARRLVAAEGPAVLFEVSYEPSIEDLLVPPAQADLPVTGEARTTWLRPPLRGRSVTSRRDEARVITETVVALVSGERPVALPSGRRATYKDCAVLAHTNEMLDETAFAFARANVPYVVAGRSFFRAREVRDVAALLSLLLDPSDRLAALTVLRGPFVGAHDATLVGLTDPGGGLRRVGTELLSGPRASLVQPEDHPRVEALVRVVTALSRVVERVGPGPVLREGIAALELEETLVLLPRGHQRVANVRKLLTFADREPNARAFLRHLGASAAPSAASEAEAATFSSEDDAVRLLTVHTSKGLDFPIVFVPQVGARAATRGSRGFAIEPGPGDAPPVLSVRIHDHAGLVHDPPSFVRARSAASRRERAERQRLAYVAITRASSAMFVVGDAKPASKEGGSPTSAAVLQELAASMERRHAAALAVENVSLSGTGERNAGSGEAHGGASSFVARPAVATFRTLPIAPESLQDFHHCPRRFQLGHLLGLPEHASLTLVEDEPSWLSVDARLERTRLHRVLERLDARIMGRREAEPAIRVGLMREGIAAEHPRHELLVRRLLRFVAGRYLSSAVARGAVLHRERAFALEIPVAEGGAVLLRGSLDLVVAQEDGGFDVVDYKRAQSFSIVPHMLQLELNAFAAHTLFPGAHRVRAGMVFLGGDPSVPQWVDLSPLEGVRARVAELGGALNAARWSGHFPRVALDRCEAILCGHRRRCHPRGGA